MLVSCGFVVGFRVRGGIACRKRLVFVALRKLYFYLIAKLMIGVEKNEGYNKDIIVKVVRGREIWVMEILSYGSVAFFLFNFLFLAKV